MIVLQQEKFGDRFLNMRFLMSNLQSLESIGASLSNDDLADIAVGKIPSSFLRPDALHFNRIGCDYMSKFIYNKLVELGYLAIEE